MIKKQIDLRSFIDRPKRSNTVDFEDENQEKSISNMPMKNLILKSDELKEYNKIPVFSKEFDCLITLEQCFGYEIPHKTSTRTRMYEFFAMNGHVIELRLTQLKFSTVEPINEIIELISDLEFLEILEWTFTDITSIPSFFGDMKHLRVLNLSHNKIEIISPEIGNLSYLEILDLSNNKINHVPLTFQNLSSLQILDLQQNQLTANSLDAAIFPDHLQYLYLQHNPINSAFHGLEDLQKKTWVFLHIPKKVPKIHQSYPFCPEHDKVMLPVHFYLNKVKGWLGFRFRCSVKTCAYTVEILPAMASLMDDFSQTHVHLPSVIIADTPKCPPHDIVIIEGKHRWIERCTKCGKTREEIEDSKTD